MYRKQYSLLLYYKHYLMETKIEKYYRQRPFFANGCNFFSVKNQFVSKTIRSCDKEDNGNPAAVSHVGKIFHTIINGKKRWMIIDSNATGVRGDLLSKRIDECDDFFIIKSLADPLLIEISLEKIFNRAEVGIKYSYWTGFKELINRGLLRRGRGIASDTIKAGFLKITHKETKDICSRLVRQSAIDEKTVLPIFSELREVLPIDYFRYRNKTMTELLF